MALTKMAGTHHPLHFRGRVHESRGDKALDRLMKSSVGRIASLSALGLTHRGLSSLFRTLLADPRRSLVNLVELKLSHDWMGVEASAVVLPHLPRLQTLDLLDVTVELQAADIMSFPSLRTANFTSTWYTDDSFRGLIRILQGSPTLERLVIDYTEGAWPSGWSLDGALSGVSVPLHMLDVIIMNSVEPSAVIRIGGALDMPKCSPVFGYVNDWVSGPELLKSQPNAHCHILQSFASCTCQLTIKFLKTHLNTLALILQPVVPEKDRKCRCPTFSVAFQEKPDTLDPFVRLGDAIKSVPNIQSRVMTIYLSLSDLSLISGSDAIEKEWKKLFSSLSSLKELHLLNVSLFDDSLRTLVQTFNADPMIGGELLSVNVEFQASDIATNSLLDEESLNRDGVREILWYALAANCEKLRFLELGPVPVGVCTDEEWCMQWHDILQLLLTRRQE
ncbi:hypothetical protein EUX98_g3149 [Antrodiella citrinella]|uniref:F-box domain-containing protein n=1 Tax=Antrodiella citrinella TaxID=2447956 RepID=A0A4S4MZT1_9APHY|nr:hypothetical protein EUX98_g3149 [Antrodiella citrinella]